MSKINATRQVNVHENLNIYNNFRKIGHDMIGLDEFIVVKMLLLLSLKCTVARELNDFCVLLRFHNLLYKGIHH